MNHEPRQTIKIMMAQGHHAVDLDVNFRPEIVARYFYQMDGAYFDKDDCTWNFPLEDGSEISITASVANLTGRLKP
jgi:hypothetical protein